MQSDPVPANIYTTIIEAMIMKQKEWSVTRIFLILGNTQGGRAGRFNKAIGFHILAGSLKCFTKNFEMETFRKYFEQLFSKTSLPKTPFSLLLSLSLSFQMELNIAILSENQQF